MDEGPLFAIHVGRDSDITAMCLVDPATGDLTPIPIIGTTDRLGGPDAAKAERIRIARQAMEPPKRRVR